MSFDRIFNKITVPILGIKTNGVKTTKSMTDLARYLIDNQLISTSVYTDSHLSKPGNYELEMADSLYQDPKLQLNLLQLAAANLDPASLNFAINISRARGELDEALKAVDKQGYTAKELLQETSKVMFKSDFTDYAPAEGIHKNIHKMIETIENAENHLKSRESLKSLKVDGLKN